MTCMSPTKRPPAPPYRPNRQMIPITQAGYDRPRRVCTRCSTHLTAGDHTCPARYTVAIAAPGADAYHKHGAIRHLSAAMESAAKKTRSSSGGGVGEGPGISETSGGKTGVVGPLAALENVYGGPQAFFAELVPMLSTEVGFHARACQSYASRSLGGATVITVLVGAAAVCKCVLIVVSRSPPCASFHALIVVCSNFHDHYFF